jgi:hypothetical protein
MLIAESELNRTQFSKEWQTMTHGVHGLLRRANTITACVSSAALLIAGVTAWRRQPPSPGTGKPSWFRAIVDGVRVAATIWFASRARGEEEAPR